MGPLSSKLRQGRKRLPARRPPNRPRRPRKRQARSGVGWHQGHGQHRRIRTELVVHGDRVYSRIKVTGAGNWTRGSAIRRVMPAAGDKPNFHSFQINHKCVVLFPRDSKYCQRKGRRRANKLRRTRGSARAMVPHMLTTWCHFHFFRRSSQIKGQAFLPALREQYTF
jgi:hypothetical protein